MKELTVSFALLSVRFPPHQDDAEVPWLLNLPLAAHGQPIGVSSLQSAFEQVIFFLCDANLPHCPLDVPWLSI